jgi:hypothetical protein
MFFPLALEILKIIYNGSRLFFLGTIETVINLLSYGIKRRGKKRDRRFNYLIRYWMVVLELLNFIVEIKF